MDTITFKKLEYILSGSKILPEEINEIVDLMDEYARQEALNKSKFSGKAIVIQEPVLVGTLNKKFGYFGFEPVEVGTNVFEFKEKYQFEIIPINGTVPTIQKFYKETLRPCIDFI